MTNEAYDNTTTLDPRIAQRLKHDDKGLVAAVIQQFDTKEVLMVGYMNDEAIDVPSPPDASHSGRGPGRSIGVRAIRRDMPSM